MSRRKQIIQPPHGVIIAEPMTPKAKPHAKKRHCIATAERHMQIIAKWERLHYITAAKAKALRDQLLEEINQ